MTESTSDRYWQTVAILVTAMVLSAGALWASRQAAATDWDEGEYVNQAIQDKDMFQKKGLYGLLHAIGARGGSRPPAYRVMVLPITIPFGVSVSATRYVSILLFAAALGLLFLLGRRLAGPACGAFSMLLLATNPYALGCSVKFYTEPSLYLSVAGVLYFLTRQIRSPARGWFDMLGLGCFLGLGLLSKTSFILMAGPMLVVAFALSRWSKTSNLRSGFLIRACLVAGFLALPWWLWNWRHALAYAQFSSAFTRHGFEGPALHKLLQWFNAFGRGAMGIALLLLVLAILVRAFLWPRLWRRTGPAERAVLGICLAAGIPLVLIQVLGVNHNMRLIAPSFFPLAVVVGWVASTTGWTRAKFLTVVATTLFAVQGATLAIPSFVRAPARESDIIGGTPSGLLASGQEWNWDVLWRVCTEHGLTQPTIQYLGSGPVYCPPLMSHPWHRRHEPVTVTWLWRYEEGAIDWAAIRSKLTQADVVVTVLNYQGLAADKEPLDNAHNGELFTLLLKDPEFEGPVEIEVGAAPPARLVAFFRQQLPLPPKMLEN
jgi:4-amino-4-deoxy-L-arabinose transferase-like glycosyltransferase